MALFEITEGSPGQGKSLYTAKRAYELAKRNYQWYLEGRPIRYIYSNLKFNDSFEKQFIVRDIVIEYGDTGDVIFAYYVEKSLIQYWTDTQQLVLLRDVDIIWDEIATELDSRNFANLTVELKRFLSQYRKRGVDIYANTQDFSMIDARARLMITGCRTLKKMIGSPDPSTTKPVVKKVWGLVLIRDVENYKEVDPQKKQYGLIPSFFFIERSLVSLYDTRQDIPMGKPAPLKHIELVCEFADTPGHKCDFHQLKHQ